MKNLYLILRSDTQTASTGLLTDAAEKKDINVKIIYSDKFDFSQNLTLTEDDGLYCLGDSSISKLVEKSLLNSKVKSFYKDYRFGIYKLDDADDLQSYLIFKDNNLPAIPSIMHVPTDQNLLNKAIDHLGGFPVIVKVAGESRGKGVFKIDNSDELLEISKTLNEKKERFILKKFTPHDQQVRVIVLGDKAIASHTNIATFDFRTNAGKDDVRKREIIEHEPEVYEIAAKAVNSLGFDFGGVDILIDRETNKPYIAEVNLPCFFPRTQELTGINIAEAMIDFLINK